MAFFKRFLYGSLMLWLYGTSCLASPLVFCEGKHHPDVRAYFTPYDSIEKLLLRTIDNAKQSIYVQAYVLSSTQITRALLAAKQRGVKVQVLVDYVEARRTFDKTWAYKKNHRFSMLKHIQDQGILVHFETQFQKAHNKIMIIDPYLSECKVITGSYNFTYSAQRYNAENIVILTGNARITQQYLENWSRHFAKSIVATFPDVNSGESQVE